MQSISRTKMAWISGAVVLVNLAMAGNASAHCDSMDGPVITEARTAIEKRDVVPLLKWVPQHDERELKSAFSKTLKDRSAGGASAEAADRKFFATLVRIHRKSEGAPFTGLKPAGQIDPVISSADASLEKMDVEDVSRHILGQLDKSLREKFLAAAESRKHSAESVERGREYVRNYVQYVHFVEALNDMAAHEPEHHGAKGGPVQGGHAH